MEPVCICLVAWGLYSMGRHLLLIRVRLDSKSNVFVFLNRAVVLKRQYSTTIFWFIINKKQDIHTIHVLACNLWNSYPWEEIMADSHTFNLSWWLIHPSIPYSIRTDTDSSKGHFVLSASVSSNCLTNPVEQIKKFGAFCLLAFHFVPQQLITLHLEPLTWIKKYHSQSKYASTLPCQTSD